MNCLQGRKLEHLQLFNYINETTDKSVILDSWCSLSDKIAADKVEQGITYLDKMKPHRVSYYGDFVLQEIFQTFMKSPKSQKKNLLMMAQVQG